MPPRLRSGYPENLGNDARIILESMDEQFSSMKEEIASLNATLSDKCKQIEDLSSEISTLKKKVSKLENALDEEDAYVRRETIIFNGSAIPPSQSGEICNNEIRKVIKEKLKIELLASDISVAHRAGKIQIKLLTAVVSRFGFAVGISNVKLCQQNPIILMKIIPCT